MTVAYANAAQHNQKGFSKIPFKVGMSRKEFDTVIEERGLKEISWPDQLEYLHQQFGRGGIAILENIKKTPSSGKPLLEDYPHCKAEMIYILENENAPHLIDILCRRTEAQWMVWHHKQTELAEKVAAIMGTYYRWSAKRKADEIKEYLEYVEKTVSFIK